MSRILAANIAAGLVFAALTAGCAPAAKLSAPEIAAKNAAARGGLDAWRKVDTMVWTGHIESAHAPTPSMQFRLEQKRPNKTRLRIDALGEKTVRVFDGVQGWRVREARGGRPDVQHYGPQELKFAQSAHVIDGPLIDYAAKGNSLTLEGVDEIGEHKAYHLGVHLAKGGNEDVWVDTGTFLDLRYDRVAEGPAGAQRRVSAMYDDYRRVEGLQIPFLIQTGGGQGTTPDKMQIETVSLNAPLDDSNFENPTAPHPRNRARPGAASQALAPVPPRAASGEQGMFPR
jgi:hypothetical protein